MYLVVGLGNPGREYEATRHNMGFDTIDHLVEDYNGILTERKWIHWLYLIIVSFVVYIGIVKTYFLRGKPWFPVIKWR